MNVVALFVGVFVVIARVSPNNYWHRAYTVAWIAVMLCGGFAVLADAPQPSPSTPVCLAHDDTQTHALFDPVGNCHYDHSHGVTRAELLAFFEQWGLPTARVQADSLALSVQTPNENQRKHSGYRWILYEVEDGCHKDDKGLVDKFGANDNCIVAFAARVHDLGGVHEVTTKIHSLALYTVACPDSNPDRLIDGPPVWSACGWSYTEQAVTFGPDVKHELHAPYQQAFAVGFEGNGILDPPYIGARTMAQCVNLARYQKDCTETWNSTRQSTALAPSLVNFDYRNYDAPQGINPTSPLSQQPLGGKYNNSERHIYVVILEVPGTGVANGSAPLCFYVDEAPCAPDGAWELHNYPAGTSVYNRTGGQRPAGIQVQDVDVYFNGQPSGWLVVHPPVP